MNACNLELATFGGGCFWCIEAIFKELKGLETVISGYTGGTAPGIPTYREVCSGLTGHAEVVQINFNTDIVPYKDLVTIFMMSHDPTTSNLQGTDYGSQYRSVIYYHNSNQKRMAEQVVKEMASNFQRSITTEISSAEKFHIAEEYHQNYYANNRTEGYCSAIIAPKLVKLRNMYTNKIIG